MYLLIIGFPNSKTIKSFTGKTIKSCINSCEYINDINLLDKILKSKELFKDGYYQLSFSDFSSECIKEYQFYGVLFNINTIVLEEINPNILLNGSNNLDKMKDILIQNIRDFKIGKIVD
jgi:hypothetical protein